MVHDGQRPHWLVPDSDQLNIPIILVNHSQIFGTNFRTSLPTFNSQAIECHLHCIPGLSEHFIYLNDDMFFGNHVQPADFFSDGVPLFNFKGYVPVGPKKKGMSQHAMAWINNRNVLKKLFPHFAKKLNSRLLAYPSHQGVPMLKSSFASLWENPDINPLLIRTSESQFRQSSNLYIIGLLVYYCKLSECGKKGRRTEAYMELNDMTDMKRSFREMCQSTAQQFCINDCVKTREVRLRAKRIMTLFLNKKFPVQTIAEKPEDLKKLELRRPLQSQRSLRPIRPSHMSFGNGILSDTGAAGYIRGTGTDSTISGEYMNARARGVFRGRSGGSGSLGGSSGSLGVHGTRGGRGTRGNRGSRGTRGNRGTGGTGGTRGTRVSREVRRGRGNRSVFQNRGQKTESRSIGSI